VSLHDLKAVGHAMLEACTRSLLVLSEETAAQVTARIDQCILIAPTKDAIVGEMTSDTPFGLCDEANGLGWMKDLALGSPDAFRIKLMRASVRFGGVDVNQDLDVWEINPWAEKLIRVSGWLGQWNNIVDASSQLQNVQGLQPWSVGLDGLGALKALKHAIALARAPVSPEMRQHMAFHLPQLDRCLRLLEEVDRECMVCLTDKSNMCMMPCCSAAICRECAQECVLRSSRCPHCRSSQGDNPVSIEEPTLSRVPTLSELAERTDGLQGAMDTMRAVFHALDTLQKSRVLIYCHYESDRTLACVFNDMMRMPGYVRQLTGLVADKNITAKFDNPDMYPAPMALLCRNMERSPDIVGQDHGCTTAIILVGNVVNPSQLVTRVLRPSNITPGQAQRVIPVIVFK
jgi:hypothetical protein